MAESNILTKTADAMKQYLSDGGITASIYAGESNEDKSLPCVSVISVSGDVIDGQEFTGNRAVTVEVEVRSAAAGDTGEHDTLVKEVGDLLNSTTLEADLSSSLDEFTCIGAIPGGETSGADGDAWLSTFRWTLWVCASDF